jgi:glycosyltransferase involved in cell wall biosynthesis
MACEVPVVSTNVGGLPEINIHGQTGYLADVGDVDTMAAYAISILGQEEELQKFRTAALAQAKRFDLQEILPQYEAYYEEVLTNSAFTVE